MDCSRIVQNFSRLYCEVLKNSSTEIAENGRNCAKSSASETSEIMRNLAKRLTETYQTVSRNFGDSEISVQTLVLSSDWRMRELQTKTLLNKANYLSLKALDVNRRVRTTIAIQPK